VRIPSTDPKAKRTALRALIDRDDVKNGIVFCNRKSEVDVVAKSLRKHGYDAAPIHGDLDQATRMRTLESFRTGALRLLCASDVAARGLDIPDVSHVFNYDVPHHADDYVHRIGRTGRAGKTGQAFMIVTPADGRNLDKVLKLIGKVPEEIVLEGIDWGSIKDEPRERRGGGGDRARGGRSRERTPRERRPREERAPREAKAEPRREPPPEPTHEPRAEAAREPRAEAPRSSPPPAREPPRPAPKAETPPPRSERPQRDEGGRRGREDGDRIVGFGSDVPAFLVRPTDPRSRGS